jgi:hypothetical protein
VSEADEPSGSREPRLVRLLILFTRNWVKPAHRVPAHRARYGKYLASAQAAGQVREVGTGGDEMMQDEREEYQAEEETADEILASVARYCQRITDSGH